jgi:hypothetical protein
MGEMSSINEAYSVFHRRLALSVSMLSFAMVQAFEEIAVHIFSFGDEFSP